MSWQSEVDRIHRTVVKRWAPYSDEDRRFLMLALAGEVGELANLVKKSWRGDFYHPADNYDFEVNAAEELADIRIYLQLLANTFHVDLDDACERKLLELYRRWPETDPDVRRESGDA